MKYIKAFESFIVEGIKLKFKNLGRFADEASVRYQAKINDDLYVNVVKTNYSYGPGYEWNATFYTKDGYSLDINDDLDYFYSSSKAKTIWLLADALDNEPGFLDKLTKAAKSLSAKMADHDKKYNIKK